MLKLEPSNTFGLVFGMFNCKIIRNGSFLAALLLAAVAVFVPFTPEMPSEGLDPSWILGMNEVVAQGMSIGEDIVFTFGPYVSIFTKVYHPATDHLMIWGSLYLALSFTLAAYCAFKSAGWPLQLALIAVLSAGIYTRDSLFFIYPLLVGLQAYRWSIARSSQIDTNAANGVLAAVLFAPLGFLPLIKGSTFIGCAAISFLSIVLLAKSRQWKLCVVAGAAPLVSLGIFWIISGQQALALPGYVAGLLPVIGGYTEAMALNGSHREWILYILATATLTGFLLHNAPGSQYEKTLLVLVFLSSFFLAFKAGFVRHDGHAMTSATMLLLGALLAGTLLPDRGALAVIAVALVVWAYIDAAHLKTSTYTAKRYVTGTYIDALHGLQSRILHPEALSNRFDARIKELKERGAIPILEGSVDIYSHDQAYLIASGNKWNPRPILQSYSAYTPDLAELNRLHLVNRDRPDNIIFKVQPIDGRLPSLEDGASWPVLLSKYEPGGISNGYLFLKDRDNDTQPYQPPRKIAAGIYSLGEQIILPEFNGVLFARIKIKRSFVGAILNTLFKPSQLEIELTMRNGDIRKYRFIAEMGRAGFVISPHIESAEEFGLLTVGPNYLNNKRVKSIKITAYDLAFFWRESFNVDFLAVNYEPSRAYAERLGLSVARTKKFEKISIARRCDGSIDYANGNPSTPEPIEASSLLQVDGWLAASVEPVEVPDNVFLSLKSSDGQRYFVNANRTKRSFNHPILNNSGFTSAADVTDLDGTYLLELAYSKGNELFICPQFNKQIHIHQE